MKRTIITLGMLLCSAFLLNAQNGINYQAVMRDGTGNVLESAPVTLRFTIYEGSATGTSVYQETHALTTNDYGLVNTVIGEGIAVVATLLQSTGA